MHGSGKIRNVSEGGLFIGTAAIPPQGELAEVTFTPPGGGRIAVTGLVWWTTDDAGGSHRARGFGLRVLEDSERFRSLVERLT